MENDKKREMAAEVAVAILDFIKKDLEKPAPDYIKEIPELARAAKELLNPL